MQKFCGKFCLVRFPHQSPLFLPFSALLNWDPKLSTEITSEPTACEHQSDQSFQRNQRNKTRNLSLVEFFNDVRAVVPGQTGAKPPRREIRAGPNKRCNTIYVSAMISTHPQPHNNKPKSLHTVKYFYD